MAAERITLIHIFVDHSNVWGGARLASRIKAPDIPDEQSRLGIRYLDQVLVGGRRGISSKIVSGGIPPGMEGLWAEYRRYRYDTQRLFRGDDWRERGVDHVIIGHMWRLLAKYRDTPSILVLASGDGHRNEFGTSFSEVLSEVLGSDRYASWTVELASFDWKYREEGSIRSPTSNKMRRLVEDSLRGRFINLMDHYSKLVYHEKKGTGT